MEIFDTVTETWSVARDDASDPALQAPFGLVMNNIFYLMGGKDTTGTDRNDVRTFDPETNTWTTVALLPGGVESVFGILYNA